MKKTILIQLFILFAFSTISMAQRSKADINLNEAPSQSISVVTDCATNYALNQPTSGIRTIEAVTQGYRDNGTCVFDVNLFVPAHLEQHLDLNNIKWEVDGVSIPGNRRQISVPVPTDNVVVSVTYIIGTQLASATRTF